MNPVEQSRLAAADKMQRLGVLQQEQVPHLEITRARLDVVDAIADHLLDVLKTRIIAWIDAWKDAE